MPNRISFAAACAATLLLAGGLGASQWNRKTTVTFSDTGQTMKITGVEELVFTDKSVHGV